MALPDVRVGLIVLAALGFWTLWGFPARNGLLKLLKALSGPGAVLPGTLSVPMKQSYTGIKIIDGQLTTLVGFFTTAIDGQRADVAICFLNLGSQVLAAWILVTTESYRAGSGANILLTWITWFGLAIAIVGYACVAPLWFALHLTLSRSVKEPRGYNLVMRQPLQLMIAPIAVLIGFGTPTVLMALPAPSILSYKTKQTWTGVQQGWPLWIFILQKTMEAIWVSVKPKATVFTEDQRRENTVKYMRRAYVVAIISSASAHLAFCGLGFTARFIPFLGAKHKAQLDWRNTFIPPNPFGSLEADTLQNGALWFLQWDLIVGVLATFVWGVAIRLTAEKKQNDLSAWLSALVKYGAVAAVVGPAGAAVFAVWERDELVLKSKTS